MRSPPLVWLRARPAASLPPPQAEPLRHTAWRRRPQRLGDRGEQPHPRCCPPRPPPRHPAPRIPAPAASPAAVPAAAPPPPRLEPPPRASAPRSAPSRARRERSRGRRHAQGPSLRRGRRSSVASRPEPHAARPRPRAWPEAVARADSPSPDPLRAALRPRLLIVRAR